MFINISVLVAGYNYLEHLDNIFAMLKSLVHHDDLEIVFVDDFSTDGSYEKITDLKYNKLKIVRNTENSGLTKSLNIAANVAVGQIFVRWDVDDKFDQCRITEIRHADSCGFNFQVMDAVGITATGRVVKKISVPKSETVAKLIAFRRNPFVHGGTSFRRELFFKFGGYNSDYVYAQDYELWTRLLCDKSLKLKKIKSIYHLLIHQGSISMTKKDAQRSYFEQARKNYWRHQLLCY